MTDQATRQRRGPVFKIPLTRWQRRQKHLQEQPSNNRALIGFTPDGEAVVNPVQAELRRLFKGVVSRPAAARIEGIRNRNPSTHEAVEATMVHVEQSNHLCTEVGREARRVTLAERDERAAEYRVGLARKVAEAAARDATETSATDPLPDWWHDDALPHPLPWAADQRKHYRKRRHGANRAHGRKEHA